MLGAPLRVRPASGGAGAGGDEPRGSAVTFDDGFDPVAGGALDVLNAPWRPGDDVRADRDARQSRPHVAQQAERGPDAAPGGDLPAGLQRPIADGVGLPRIATRVGAPERRDAMGHGAQGGARGRALGRVRHAAAGRVPRRAPALLHHEPRRAGAPTATRRPPYPTHPDCSRLDADGLRREIIEPARTCATSWVRVARLLVSLRSPLRAGARTPARGVRASWTARSGILGLSPRGTSRLRLERASIEGDMRFSVYGKALLGFPRSRLA